MYLLVMVKKDYMVENLNLISFNASANNKNACQICTPAREYFHIDIILDELYGKGILIKFFIFIYLYN